MQVLKLRVLRGPLCTTIVLWLMDMCWTLKRLSWRNDGLKEQCCKLLKTGKENLTAIAYSIVIRGWQQIICANIELNSSFPLDFLLLILISVCPSMKPGFKGGHLANIVGGGGGGDFNRIFSRVKCLVLGIKELMTDSFFSGLCLFFITPNLCETCVYRFLHSFFRAGIILHPSMAHI